MLALFASHSNLNSKQRKTLKTVFSKPTSPNIIFSDLESLVVALGGEVFEREGSRIKIILQDEIWRCHRPHPGKEAKRYQVEEFRAMLQRLNIDEESEGV